MTKGIENARKVEIHYEPFWLGESKILIDGVDVLSHGGQPGYLEEIRITSDKADGHRASLKLTFGVYPDELTFTGVTNVFPELTDGLRFYRPKSRLLATVFNLGWWRWQWRSRFTKQGRARAAWLRQVVKRQP